MIDDPCARFPVGSRMRELATGAEGTVVASGRGTVRVRYDFDGDDDHLYFAEALRSPTGERWVFPTIVPKEYP